MWTQHHVAVFLLTFVSFSIFHASRKTYGSVKDLLSEEWSPQSCNATWPCPQPQETWTSHSMFSSYKKTQPFLGLLDMLFSLSYAIGLFFSGIIGDRVNLRLFLSFGMAISAVLLFIFGTITEWFNIYNKPLYAVLWFLEGLAQSIGWPVVVTVMGNWFDRSTRGLVFGVWSSSAAIGNIVGSVLTASVLEYGYEVAFFCTSCLFFFMSFVVFFGLVSSPKEITIPESQSDKVENESLIPTNNIETDIFDRVRGDESNQNIQIKKIKAISFKNALLLPGVIPYSLVFAFLKTTNYTFFFWLPYYLVNKYNWSDKMASNISSWYDVGGVIGGIVFGAVSDRMNRRSPVLLFMLAVAPVTIIGYSHSPNNKVVNSVLMCLVGIFVNGTSNIVGSAVTTDVGKQGKIGENTRALSTVTGIIDGVGTTGVAIGQFVVNAIMYHFGWNSVFIFLSTLPGAAVVCLLPVFLKDMGVIKKIKTRFSSNGYEEIPGTNEAILQ